MSTETKGRLVITDETCRFCGTHAREIHPAGVIATGNWKCTRCGHRQHDDIATEHLEGID